MRGVREYNKICNYPFLITKDLQVTSPLLVGKQVYRTYTDNLVSDSSLILFQSCYKHFLLLYNKSLQT